VNLSRVDLKLQRGGCNVKSLHEGNWWPGFKEAMDRRILAADGPTGLRCKLSIVVAVASKRVLPSKLAKSDTEKFFCIGRRIINLCVEQFLEKRLSFRENKPEINFEGLYTAAKLI
jgi:hypothetical protein